MLKRSRRRRELPPPRLRRRRPGRDLRRGRDVQVVPPEHLREVGHHQARPGLRRHRQRPEARADDHQFDAECVSCHTTGFEYTSGWKSAELTALPQGQPVRELPRPGLEARRRARRQRLPQGDRPDRRPRPTRTASASAATTRTTRPTSTSPSTRARSSTRGSTTTTTRRSTRDRPPKVARRRAMPRHAPTSTSRPSGSPRADGRPPAGTESRDESPRLEARPVRGEVPPGPPHPVNHVLHVGVGWPMVALAVDPAAVPAALVARPVPRRLRPHVLRPLRLRAEHPDDPQAPEHAVRDRLGRDPRPLRRPGPPGDPAAGPVSWRD